MNYKKYKLLSYYKKEYLLEIQDKDSYILYCANGKRLLITHGDEFGNIYFLNKYDKCEYDEIICCYQTFSEEIFCQFAFYDDFRGNFLFVYPKSSAIEIDGSFENEELVLMNYEIEV